MQLRLAYGEVLSLSGGVPSDRSPRVYVSVADTPLPGRSARVLLALVEPVEPTPAVDELAEQVIATLVRSIDNLPAAEAGARLTEAFDQTNRMLCTVNRRPGARRTLLGLTCAVGAGSRLLVAHVPPGQLIVRQGRELSAYPEIRDWGLKSPAVDAPYARPLGLQGESQPALLFTTLASGDIFGALSTTAAALLGNARAHIDRASSGDDLLSLVGDACDRAALRDGAVGVVGVSTSRRPPHDSSSSRYRYQRPARVSFDTRAANYSTPRVISALDRPGKAVQTGSAHDGTDSSGHPTPVLTGVPVAASSAEVGDRTDELPIAELRSTEFQWGVEQDDAWPWLSPADDRRSKPNSELRIDRRTTGFAMLSTLQAPFLVDFNPTPAGILSLPGDSAMTNLVAGLLLSLVATVVGVWTVARRDRPLHGPRDDGTLGLPRLQRWDVSHRPPRFQRMRSALPHLEAGRIILLGLLLIALVAGSMYGVSRLRAPGAADAEEFEERFQVVLARHADALAAPDQPTAYAILIEARAHLEELAADLPAGSVDARIEQERLALQIEVDRLANISRFNTVNVIGSVPPAPENVNPRLIAGGGRVFLLSDALYQLDSANASLVRLIASGDVIGEHTVGTIRGAVWRGDRPVVIDETAAWNLDPATGTWSREPLGTFDAGGYVAVGAVESFELNLYLLATDSGQILKFQAGAYQGSPEDWANGVPSDDLALAVDLAVDGHIWALMPDGEVLNLFRSRVEAQLEPVYVPPLDSAVAITALPNSPYLYVLNASDGRIIRLARDGRIVQQFTTPLGTASLHSATDFVIDEGTGVAFVLAGDTIYSVRIPAPSS